MNLQSPHEVALFGWDDTPGIVSVSADRTGRALVWQRLDGRVTCTRERFRPWLLATTLTDLEHLGASLVPAGPTTPPNVTCYQELDGPPGSYRFLLSASSERSLERAICIGAARRLGQPVPSLRHLPDYYRVGPVEQYLMQTGRSYFRGLAYDDLDRLQVDLETTSLTPDAGRIFLIAVRDSRGLEVVLEAPDPADEARLIRDLCDLIRARDPDVLENHNLLGFDLPFLHARAQQVGVPLRLGRSPGSPTLQQHPVGRRQVRFQVAGRELVDTLEAVRRHDFVVRDLPSHGLKAVARAFGVARPERVYLPGAEIAATYARDPETVRRYALDDVAEVDALSQRLLGPAFALAGMAPRPYERLVAAGPAMGILEPMLVRAYLQRGAALPGPGVTRTGGAHAGGAAYLFATGVAVQVVKADIASLYPSLMRCYAIGPRSDPLGVLLALVGNLTDLRLAHKDAVRTDAAHAGYHQAMQAAMKLIINSAYGYLGAGEMALFGDPQAADEVTRRGREVLDGVVAELRARGVALIEADTDGVYFAVPVGWTEDEERALVAEVAATLPTGLRLEYEGRYQAMFSHEVKNYALLTYDGELIRRGVALRSSRAERYGERFLEAALRCLLEGDVPGIRAAFLDTVAALRERRVPVQEVTTRVRLTKDPATYQHSRPRQREAAYEALLAAGRDEWRPGERVRLYHRADGQVVWLPDEEPDAPAGDLPDYDSEYYVRLLRTSYAARLAKAFAPEDMERLFRLEAQMGLFDRPLAEMEPRGIRCSTSAG